MHPALGRCRARATSPTRGSCGAEQHVDPPAAASARPRACRPAPAGAPATPRPAARRGTPRRSSQVVLAHPAGPRPRADGGRRARPRSAAARARPYAGRRRAPGRAPTGGRGAAAASVHGCRPAPCATAAATRADVLAVAGLAHGSYGGDLDDWVRRTGEQLDRGERLLVAERRRHRRRLRPHRPPGARGPGRPGPGRGLAHRGGRGPRAPPAAGWPGALLGLLLAELRASGQVVWSMTDAGQRGLARPARRPRLRRGAAGPAPARRGVPQRRGRAAAPGPGASRRRAAPVTPTRWCPAACSSRRGRRG